MSKVYECMAVIHLKYSYEVAVVKQIANLYGLYHVQIEKICEFIRMD